MADATQERIKAAVDKGLAEKELGNAAFKAGDVQQAVKHYYGVILNLKGLNAGGFSDVKIPTSMRNTNATAPKISEISLSDDEDEDTDVVPNSNEKEASDEKAAKKVEAEADDPNDIYSTRSIKKTLAQCHVNMAICSSKKGNWAACKRNAESALIYEENNFKAKFRIAQATVRLGEVTKGRQLLNDLKKDHQDAAIDNELKVLEAAEAAREKKSKDSMRGFINKANPPKISKVVDEPIAKEENKISEIPETPSKDQKKADDDKTSLPPTPPKSE